ncbi:glycosyltransferase family 2 protein [Dyadobacter sp. CY345]|uniref:glycosyltransferase family 2 protein n=1 Tax=Dyadobacter sp. CY345 TaxID=2909335 RepID=UPI001F390ABA|nr:glycosyltransferase family 2 protein [Dyadobacter sp. CY345]MCF2446187.1 glycosyltransferase family 2 protein [Dyadobacter sp. CY345]
MDTALIPKISVIMPVYNSEQYVFEAINSIISQTFRDFELIIINDGSTDDSEKIILSITDHRIRYFMNSENLGIICTRNFGLQQARCEYIAMMDSDDVSFPGRLEKQYGYMSKNPLAGVCGAVMEFIGDKQGHFENACNTVSTFTKLMTAPPFGQSTAFIRKSVLDKHALQYNPDYPHAEDYKLWLDISKYSEIYCLPETLVYYRFHLSNDSRIHQANQQQSALKTQKDWFEYVLNKKLNADESDYFKGIRTFKSCFYYNLLCFLVVKNATIPVDNKIVMEQRMRNNLLIMNSFIEKRFTILLFLVKIIDRIISKCILHLTPDKTV